MFVPTASSATVVVVRLPSAAPLADGSKSHQHVRAKHVQVYFFVFDLFLTTLSKKLILFTTIRVYPSKTGKKRRPESPRRGPVLLGRARVPMLASPFGAYGQSHGRSRTRHRFQQTAVTNDTCVSCCCSVHLQLLHTPTPLGGTKNGRRA